jgi:adenylylsulfate kinase-like enzyme
MWITRLSGLGESTLTCILECCLMSKGSLYMSQIGDNMHHCLTNNLGFSIVD